MTPTNRSTIRRLALAFQERAHRQGYQDQQRHDAAVEFFCGAATLAEISDNPSLLADLHRVLMFLIVPRGWDAVVQLATVPDAEPVPDVAL